MSETVVVTETEAEQQQQPETDAVAETTSEQAPETAQEPLEAPAESDPPQETPEAAEAAPVASEPPPPPRRQPPPSPEALQARAAAFLDAVAAYEEATPRGLVWDLHKQAVGPLVAEAEQAQGLTLPALMEYQSALLDLGSAQAARERGEPGSRGDVRRATRTVAGLESRLTATYEGLGAGLQAVRAETPTDTPQDKLGTDARRALSWH